MVSHIGCMLQHCVDIMADVIAKVADGRVTKGWVQLSSVADVIAMVADGIGTKVLFYFNFSSEVVNRTSPHMCGRWYLPVLLRDGLVGLMYNASLMVLMMFWSSPHYTEIFYSDSMTNGVRMVIYCG